MKKIRLKIRRVVRRRLKKIHPAVKTLLVVYIFLIGTTALFFCLDWSASYQVNAVTEQISIKSRNKVQPVWHLKGITLYTNNEEFKNFNGSIQVLSAAEMRFVFSGAKSLVAELLPLDSEDPYGTDCTKKGVELTASVQGNSDSGTTQGRFCGAIGFSIDYSEAPNILPHTFVIPFRGNASIGGTIFNQNQPVTPLLLDGTIKILGSATITGKQFEAGERKLMLADTLVLTNRQGAELTGKEGDEVRHQGLIRISHLQDELRMEIIYHVSGAYPRIIRFGSEGYQIKPSYWERFKNDPTLVLVLLLIGAILPGLTEVLIDRMIKMKKN